MASKSLRSKRCGEMLRVLGVALCVDDQGRLIAGDQNGGLFRITLQGRAVASVLPLDIEIGYVNGLTFAFGSLYAVVAEEKYEGELAQSRGY